MDPDSTPPVAIRLTNVMKHFKDRDVEALDGIDLAVAQGEFLSLIGPSGSVLDRDQGIRQNLRNGQGGIRLGRRIGRRYVD